MENINPFEDFFIEEKKPPSKNISPQAVFENNSINIKNSEINIASEDLFKNLKTSFLTAEEACAKEEAIRRSRCINKMPTYGVKFLNDVCFGILPSELVVIGAGTGVGKSQISNDLAFINAYNGKKVYLFSLEGDENEVMARARWQSICDDYYKNPTGIDMNYQKYLMNQLPELEIYEQNFRNKMKRMEDRFNIFDRKSTLDIHTLSQKISMIKEADLIILDHLHYLSLDDGKESTQLTEIMRTIKDITEIRGIPFVVVSHLRKKTKDRDVLPDNDDFHGTSNIAKIASTCIIISPWTELDNESAGLSATMFRITKSRNGAPKKYIGNVPFDNKRNTYVSSYTLHRIMRGELQETPYHEYPEWASKSIRGII